MHDNNVIAAIHVDNTILVAGASLTYIANELYKLAC